MDMDIKELFQNIAVIQKTNERENAITWWEEEKRKHLQQKTDIKDSHGNSMQLKPCNVKSQLIMLEEDLEEKYNDMKNKGLVL